MDGCEKCGKAGRKDAPAKWSWAKFFKGKCSNKFIAFLVATALATITMFTAGVLHDAVSQRTLIIIWGIVTVVFMFSEDLGVAVRNMNINANFSAGAKKKINTSTADVLRATREGKR